MPIIFGNARIGFPHRRSYSSKTKSELCPPTINLDNRNAGDHTTDANQTGILLSIPGPEKHIWTIRQITHEEHPDDMQMTPWKKPLARLVGLTGVMPVILTSYTAYYQLLTVLDMRKDQTYPAWRVFLAWFIVGWGFLMTLPNILLVAVKLRTLWGKFRPRLRLVGSDVPFIDVIIPCCKEPLDVLQDTIMAAIGLDYPENRFRVIVTDDGASIQLESWIVELGQHNLYYTARAKNVPADFKAGNINHAVRFIAEHLGNAAEFIASLDADMIPEKDWLRAVAAHMVLDPKLGVVCPSQNFYNFPENDPLYQSQLNSWRCIDIIRDFADISWNTGSGFILRRQALVDIGGFPTHSLTEDVLSSMMMMAKGWKTAYLAESLQHGLMPDSYQAHIKQFTRWNQGGVQMAAHFRFYLLKSHTGMLTIWQKLLGLSYGILAGLTPFLIIVEMVATPLYFINGVSLVYFSNTQGLRILLRIRCISVLSRWVHDCHLGLMSTYRVALREEAQAQFMAPYYAIANLRSFILPRRFGGTAPGFTSSGSITASVYERSARQRASLSARLHHIIIDCGAWFHVVLIITLSFTATYRIRCILAHYPLDLSGHRDWHGLGITLLRDIFWPHPTWFVSILACLTPIKYALLPPDVPSRESLMGAKGENGARYPIPSAKKVKFSRVNAEFAQLYTILVIPYCFCLLAASWWI